MADLKIKKLLVISFGKFFALYSLLTSIIVLIIDFVSVIVGAGSSFVGFAGVGSFLLYALGILILSPILGFFIGIIFAFIINLALSISRGLEIETE